MKMKIKARPERKKNNQRLTFVEDERDKYRILDDLKVRFNTKMGFILGEGGDRYRLRYSNGRQSDG